MLGCPRGFFNPYDFLRSVHQFTGRCCRLLALLSGPLFKSSETSSAWTVGPLPEACGNRRAGAVLKTDRILPARRPADPAPVAPLLVYDGLLARGAVGDGAELAKAHAFPAASARFRVNRGNIFRPEHDGDCVGYRGTHGHAVRTVAVADSADEGRVKGPDGMTEAFGFMGPECRDRFLPRQSFELTVIGRTG
jgi:hypothetical protein